MFLFRLIPWEYPLRNLLRRPLRTLLTLGGLTTVILLILVVVGFVRGLERSLRVSGEKNVALIISQGMGENLEYSSLDMGKADQVVADLQSIDSKYGQPCASKELYLGTQIRLPQREEASLGLVRGVTPSVVFVRPRIQINEGAWPSHDEVMVGSLAAAKLGVRPEMLAIGNTLEMEGRTWRISGHFSADGSAFESEIWCRLDGLQQAMKRQDLSLVALAVAPGNNFVEIDLDLKDNSNNLELVMLKETDYYQRLQEDYAPVRMLAWLVVTLVAGAGVFAGLNTMYGSVVGRTAELATLQTMGFVRRAILVSLIQEGVLLAATASLLASLVALVVVDGISVRFTMGAFALCVDEVTILIGCATGFLLGVLGALPPAMRALRMPIVEGLKTV